MRREAPAGRTARPVAPREEGDGGDPRPPKPDQPAEGGRPEEPIEPAQPPPRPTRPAEGHHGPVTPPLPRELQVEVTGACNLRCRMCLVRYRPALDRVADSMCLHTFRGLVDAVPHLERVTLQGLGEPLMAPDLVAMVAHASARGIDVGFNTNATLLTRAKANELIDAGLAWLHVSVDGATPATYEAIRGRAAFEAVGRNTAALVDVMRERGATRPAVQVVFVAQRSNLHELPALVELVHRWGVPELRVQNLSHDFGDTDPTGEYRAIREYAAAEALWRGADRDVADVFGEARRRADALGVRLRLPATDPDAPEDGARGGGGPGCDWPWRSAYVTHDARVQPCCMVMGSDRAVLGDLSQDDFADVWHGPAYRDFRARLLTDEPPRVCRGCSLYRGVF
jgi:MoaA/NifB/PqqE/SkfB family radical SAM enzyme